jgi:zinc transport system ATP-binding protein
MERTLDNDVLARLENAGYAVNGRQLVHGVNLTVRRGEIVTLIGPNGSGKSTTAKLVLGIRKPTQGRALRAGGLRIGYVPQRLQIDWTLPLTVARFMRLTGRLSKSRLKEALAATGVDHLADAQIADISGGEFQRVLLARAISVNPELLVLDEPVQGVDYSGEVELYRLIADIRDRINCGILLVSHDLHIVMAATDHVICLNGHVCCEGAPKTVSETAEYRRLFGERAESALAVYRHDHDHVHLPDGSVGAIDAGLENDG